MKKLIFTLLSFFIVLSASAHAVFIETSLKGIQGKSHAIKIVYGEPDEHEVISKWWWYKAGMEITLTLIKPDGSTSSLTTTAQDDHLLTSFIPDQDGMYHVSLKRDTERTGFYRLADHYINTRAVTQNGNDYFQYYNIDGVKLYGFEAEVKYGFKDLFAITLNGSYDKAIDNAKYTDDSGNQQVSLNYGHQLANRPWIYGNVDVSLIQNNWFQKGSRIQLSYLHQYSHWFYLTEAYLGSLESKDHIPSQNIHSAVLSYAWDRNKYNVSFEARNLTDERAYDNFRLQKPGRAFYVKLRLSIM